jgi:hypothetical protein
VCKEVHEGKKKNEKEERWKGVEKLGSRVGARNERQERDSTRVSEYGL